MCDEKIHTGEPPNNAIPINPFGQSGTDSRALAMAGADPSAVAAAEVAKTQLQLAYFMAMQKPRDRHASWGQIQAACQRPAFAEKAIYKKPMGGDTVSGPSVRLAEEIIRQWGNILVRTQVIFEDLEKRRVAVQVIDLESNNQYIKEIVTNKTVERKFAGKDREIVGERLNSSGKTVFIVKATEEELHNKEAAAISKAIRNEGLRLVPADVVEDAVNTCLEVRGTADKEDPDKQLKTLIAWFSSLRVDVAALQDYLGHSLDTVAPSELEGLRGIYRAIFDGETTWNEVIEQKTASDPNNAGKTMMDVTADQIKKDMGAAEAERDENSGTNPETSVGFKSKEPAAVPTLRCDECGGIHEWPHSLDEYTDGFDIFPDCRYHNPNAAPLDSISDTRPKTEPDDFDLMEEDQIDNFLAHKKAKGLPAALAGAVTSALKSDNLKNKRELARKLAG